LMVEIVGAAAREFIALRFEIRDCWRHIGVTRALQRKIRRSGVSSGSAVIAGCATARNLWLP
jgi:hypothetical protein